MMLGEEGCRQPLLIPYKCHVWFELILNLEPPPLPLPCRIATAERLIADIQRRGSDGAAAIAAAAQRQWLRKRLTRRRFSFTAIQGGAHPVV